MDISSIQQVNHLLSEFGKIRGFASLNLSEHGTLAFDHPSGINIVIELSPDGQTLHWYSRLCAVPADERESFLGRVLEMNLLGVETKGVVLALDQNDNTVVASYSLQLASLDPLRFSNVMENFLNTALELQRSLSGSVYGNASADEGVHLDDTDAISDDDPPLLRV